MQGGQSVDRCHMFVCQERPWDFPPQGLQNPRVHSKVILPHLQVRLPFGSLRQKRGLLIGVVLPCMARGADPFAAQAPDQLSPQEICRRILPNRTSCRPACCFPFLCWVPGFPFEIDQKRCPLLMVTLSLFFFARERGGGLDPFQSLVAKTQSNYPND